MFPFMTGIAWCLDVTPIPIVSLGLWGAGCLAEGFDHVLLQVLALRPLHDLVFCLCHHILLGVASIEEWRRNECL
ncbi:hypothetical protein C7974DRAFT_392104 [Boeremia exigua]|uniref:uncharacterized protein n=1 Tax=Boeremia exigua TaxID=749465 RepID=UPI001E8D57DB|nr:uncharacterized protein C7974DRAFT_392104 [Boeremia exigua]KAH6633081.1 hypothetical protein C7974DRAFT_392104 [Boeremia exigua]